MVSSEISVTKEALMFGNGGDGADESGGEESEDSSGPVYSLEFFSSLPFCGVNKFGVQFNQ